MKLTREPKMKTYKEFMSNSESSDRQNNPNLDDQSCEELLDEGFASGAIITTKLNSMKNRVLSEDNPKKQNDIIAGMLVFGLGAIALVTNDKRRRK